MSILEFEQEPVKGIPGLLPADERILWQGGPTWRSLMMHVLHVRFIAAYFGAIMAWRGYRHVADGNGIEVALTSASWLGVLGLLVIALAGGVALMMKRTTVYTITSKRVILRYGMVLPVAVNLPFARIETVGLETFGDGTGDIPMTLGGADQLAYWMLWPHVRRWHFWMPQPMIRSVPDAARVSGLLADAVAATLSDSEAVMRTPARQPAALHETGGAMPAAA